MGFRIETVNEGNRTVIQVAGAFGGQALMEVRRLCKITLGPLCLDLSNLQSAEEEGVRYLKELEESGVTLVGLSPYIRLLMK